MIKLKSKHPSYREMTECCGTCEYFKDRYVQGKMPSDDWGYTYCNLVKAKSYVHSDFINRGVKAIGHCPLWEEKK